MKNSNKSSELFYSKVALLLKEKKYIEAKNLIINSANTLEKDARYYFYLGLANKFLKLYDEALENFQKCFELDRRCYYAALSFRVMSMLDHFYLSVLIALACVSITVYWFFERR